MGERGAILSIIVYILLSILKLFIGYTAHSEALQADGYNNTTDIIASITVLIGLRLSQKPPDHDHPYGHWRAETVASMVASFIMMSVGLQVLYQAILTLLKGETTYPDWTSAYTAIFCAIIMFFVYRFNHKLAVKIKSHSVMAAAKDNLSDAWVSVGTTIGIVGSQFGLPWLDSVTAIIVGLLICKTAWDIFREATLQLTDGFDEEELTAYKGTIAQVPGVKKVKAIKARSYGSNAIVDVIILVDASIDVRISHDISSDVEKVLITKHDIYLANVHVEPLD